VTESEDMPFQRLRCAALAFGDFRRGYLIVDRLGVPCLRDPYSAKALCALLYNERVGGGVQNFERSSFEFRNGLRRADARSSSQHKNLSGA